MFYRVIGDTRLKTSTLAIADANWDTLRQINLPTNLNTNLPLEVQIVVTSPISQNDSHDQFTEKSIEVTGYADDFAFVVPEPATMSLLALGAVSLLRRRK
ncbi:MAG: PEP-CTERM sorting domain-containing protein [Planctomycetaceae bacterium]|nr:MAG: PEP-CTERM sorting domain-containing protein [Planctomycetaceae bacterium]